MNLMISFSGRGNGNCDRIAEYIAAENDRIVHFRELNVYPCCGCAYECFHGPCKYREDDSYGLYSSMCDYDKVILLVPMYCGNPSALYFIFNERGQDYFMHNDTYEEIIKRLYIIGIYGKAETSPDFIPCLEKWFDCSPYQNRVLGIQRHRYDQSLRDHVLDVAGVKEMLEEFLK